MITFYEDDMLPFLQGSLDIPLVGGCIQRKRKRRKSIALSNKKSKFSVVILHSDSSNTYVLSFDKTLNFPFY
jgi:hypothetical protein